MGVGVAIPPRAGVGFKPAHAAAIDAGPAAGVAPAVHWFEVHAENYMVAGGPRLRQLEALRERFPLSLHGVGLSLGGIEPPDHGHLAALRSLADRIEPGLVSEHLAWSSDQGVYLADLLPVPRTRTALARLVEGIERTQDALGRRILIENPSSYLELPGGEMSEPVLLAEVARRSGCGLLVDVNNVYVSACNLGFDPAAYVDALPATSIEEIHLAGHHVEHDGTEVLLVDTHGAPVAEAVWALYARLVARVGPRPTLVEWDTDVPAWETLEAEARRADAVAAEASAATARMRA
ncbi:MAG: DUF692 domain-containing protein [Chromatiales bacterium]|nr:DUF692 domain-containing protein [Chromatiales bacterium]